MRRGGEWWGTPFGSELARARMPRDGGRRRFNRVCDKAPFLPLVLFADCRSILDVECALLQLTDTYNYVTGADKSLSHERLQEWLTASLDEFGGIPEMWKLHNLCVDPRFQRRGIGGLLMKWGKEQAEKEGCPIGLSSSMKGSGLYLKNGFRRYATIRVKDFPVEDVPVFLWEPPGTVGVWGTRGDMTVHQ